jgi:nitroreductase
MDVLDAIYNRRAVRAYADQHIDQPTVLRLIEAAVQAPSAINQQPWAFVVVRDREQLARISRDARRYLLETIPDHSPMARLKEHVADPSFDILYGAPALIIICATSNEPGATEDCALAAENLMLAARALDLGSCWIGLARPWLNQSSCKRQLGIELHYIPVAPIIVGHPVAWPEKSSRSNPEIHWVGS